MARKIKITSKTIKKWTLIALLAVLVVGFGVIVVQSFGKGNILSNNTVLNDLDYSDEYRLYLEKQLVAKSFEGDYKTIIENKINDKKEQLQNDGEKKLADLNAEYDKKLLDAEAEYKAKEEKKLADIDVKIENTRNDSSLSENEKKKKIADYEAEKEAAKKNFKK